LIDAVIGNVHKQYHKLWTVSSSDMPTNRQRDRQTDMQAYSHSSQ